MWGARTSRLGDRSHEERPVSWHTKGWAAPHLVMIEIAFILNFMKTVNDIDLELPLVE